LFAVQLHIIETTSYNTLFDITSDSCIERSTWKIEHSR